MRQDTFGGPLTRNWGTILQDAHGILQKKRWVAYGTVLYATHLPWAFALARYRVPAWSLGVMGVVPPNLQPHFRFLALFADTGECDRRNVPEYRLI